MKAIRGPLVLFLAFLGACGDARPPTTDFVYARGKDSPGLDPAEETDGESAIVITNVYDTLVQYRHGSGTELEPALATRWESSTDHRSMTFTLRDGVRFHDGRPLDAAAVAVNFERQRDPAHPFHFIGPEGEYSYWGAMFQSVERTVAVDARTVRFEFREPAPPFFLALLAMFSASIVSPGALEKGKDHVARNPVGTGPFRFASWDSEELTLESNPDWWGGRPKIDRLVFVVKQEPKVAFMALQGGQVHGIDNVDAQDVARVESDPSLALHRVAGMNVCYLTMNNERPPFSDARVRRAVALAIDRDRIVSAGYDGQAIPTRTLVPPTIDGHAQPPARARDLVEARRLVQEAGAKGMEVVLSFGSNPRPYLPRPHVVAPQIREDLLEIGLQVRLDKAEWNPFLDRLGNGEHQMSLIGWSADVADADNFLYVLLDKDSTKKPFASNYSFYMSERFHQAVLGARRTYDPGQRRAFYAEAQRLVDEDAPLVPLVHTPVTKATLARVEGFRVDPVTSPRFAWVSLRSP